MNWDVFVLVVLLLISVAKLLDVILIYEKDKIHEKLTLYWLILTDIKFKDLLIFSIKKTNFIFEKLLGCKNKLYRNLFLLGIGYIIVFSIIGYIHIGNLVWDFFASHLIWSSISFILSVLLTKMIIHKAIKSKSNFKLILYLILDFIILLFLLSFNPWKTTFSIDLNYQGIIEHYTHQQFPTLDKNLEKVILKNTKENTIAIEPNLLKYLIKRRFIEDEVGHEVKDLITFLRKISSYLVIIPTLLNFIIIFFIFFMYLIIRPSLFLIERTIYVVAEDPKKSIFVIIASFLSMILAIGNAFMKI